MLRISRRNREVFIHGLEGHATKIELPSTRDARLLECCEELLVSLNVCLHFLHQCSDLSSDEEIADTIDQLTSRIQQQITYIERGTGTLRHAA